MKNYLQELKKVNFTKILLSILLSIFTLCTFLLAINSENKSIVRLEFNLSDFNDIEIKEITINNNNYLNTNKYDKYIQDDGTYKFNTKSVSFEITSNDDLFIKFNEKYKDYIKVIVNNEVKTELTVDDGNYIYEQNTPIYSILKEKYLNTNFVLLSMIFSIIFIMNYILITNIYYFLNRLICNQFVIKQYLLAMLSLFLLFYTNFYFIISIFSYLIIIPIFILLCYLIYKFGKYKNLDIHNKFIAFLSFLGIIILFVVPPFNIPDEGSHFTKAYDHLFYLENDHTIIRDYPFSLLPDSVNKFYVRSGNNVLTYNLKLDSKIYFQEYVNKINPNKVSNGFSKYATYYSSNFAYIPANIAISICKMFNTSVLFMFMCGRFINMLCYVMLCYLAIKISPKYKYALMLAMTLPIAIHQGIGINQDSLNNGFFFLLFAFIINKIYSEKQLNKKDIFILIILSLCLIECKLIYIPVILLIVFISNKKMKKPIFTKTLLIMFAIICSGIAYIGINDIIGFVIGESRTVAGTESKIYTFSLIFEDPIKLFKIYINTFNQRGILDLYNGLYNGFGWSKAWMNNWLFNFIDSSLYLILILTLPYENNEKKHLKVGFIILAIILFLFVDTSLLFSWTENTSNYIWGLQPRYFIPVVVIIYIFLNNNLFSYTGKKYNLFFFISILLINTIAIAVMIKEFYL